ncbi:glycosyltransferase family 4 protein [Loktanella sp. DJP18]|uniref:glycosyltransferase family 4 protein n=1 Tax=Loktanella sp. DJP18 TaxID=3409788 RepID=UPI003BB62373
MPLPQLPVIPLGIHAADFAPQDGARARMRDRFGAGDALVVMTMGRLTSVEKANPAPMFIALDQAAKLFAQPIHIWMVGWADRAEEEAPHRDGAAALAPSIHLQIIDGRDADIRRAIWAGADVFTLPADNIQETFGLVPVEAMAAGLPVVMPDWDGFRDTVVHGETGFLIPTRMPGGGYPVAIELARRFADGTDGYLQHLALMQQQTQIDIGSHVAAFVALSDADLRARMGRDGQAHVQAHLEWAAVIPRYLELGEKLAARRRSAVPPLNPMQIDPFTLYGRYPTESPDGDWIVTQRRPLDMAGLAVLDKLNGRALYQRTLLAPARMVALLETVGAEGPMAIGTAAGRLKLRIDLAIGAALFLAKYDYLTVAQPQTNSGRN